MNIFFGAAIQGVRNRGERSHIYSALIECIKTEGHCVFSEHTAGTDSAETSRKLEHALGPLPPADWDRRIFVRNKMIEAVEGAVDAAVFELSVPSLGTGIEMAHAYLRPRMGLAEIPILALYQRGFWPNELSTMVRGITPETVPSFQLCEYSEIPEATRAVREFLGARKGPSSP